MDDIKTQPETPEPVENNVHVAGEPSQDNQPAQPSGTAALAADTQSSESVPPNSEPAASTEPKPEEPATKPAAPAPKPPKNPSAVPVTPIFIAIVIAGALIAIAVYLAIKEG